MRLLRLQSSLGEHRKALHNPALLPCQSVSHYFLPMYTVSPEKRLQMPFFSAS